MNPLLQKFNTKHNSAPFNEIKEEHYLPAFKELIEKSKKEIDEIANNSEEPTFSNTIEALAYSGEQLDAVSNIFFNLNSAETNDEIQKIAQEVSPLLSEYSSQISQNEALFNRIKKVFDGFNSPPLEGGASQRRDRGGLNEEQTTLLNETYKGFVRNGALLNDEDKKKLEKINMDLSLKSLQFGQNVLAETNNYFKHILDKNDLAGIPEAILAQFAEEAKERNLEGYVITLQYPSYVPFITYCENRELRKELALESGKKAFEGTIEKYLVEENGETKLKGICIMAGLNGIVSFNGDRDGSYEYYLSEPVGEDDPKGTGPLMMAYSEILMINNKKL